MCTELLQAKCSTEKLLAEKFDTVVASCDKPLYVGARRQLREAIVHYGYDK